MLIGEKAWFKKYVYIKKKYIFTFKSIVPASLKNAQVTGFIHYPFSLNIWQIYIAPRVLQNKQDSSSLCLIFLYFVLLSTPTSIAGNEMAYFWNILQCFQLCSAYTKTKQIHNRGLWDWMGNASKRRTGCSTSQSSNSWQKARQIKKTLKEASLQLHNTL